VPVCHLGVVRRFTENADATFVASDSHHDGVGQQVGIIVFPKAANAPFSGNFSVRIKVHCHGMGNLSWSDLAELAESLKRRRAVVPFHPV
jgi:hypothetical protein